MMRLPRVVLVEADFFISYLRGDQLAENALRLLERGLDGEVSLLTSSEVYDDVITAYRTKGFSIERVGDLLSDMRAIPHEALPVTNETALRAMRLYAEHGGSRRLHYFDAFHVATAALTGMPLVTSDRYVLENSAEMKIESIDLRKI